MRYHGACRSLADFEANKILHKGSDPLDEMRLVVPAIILFAAAFVQGLTGFGFGIIAMSLLPLAMPFRHATLLVAVLGLVLNVVTFLRCRSDYEWRRGWQLIAGAALGCPLGVYLVQTLDEPLMIRLLGALIIAFSLRELVFSRGLDRAFSPWSALPLGGLSGLFGAAFNIGGPPAIAYVYSQSWSQRQMIALLQVMFLEIGILRVGLTAMTGHVDKPVLIHSALLLLPLIVAVFLGHWVLERLTPGRMKRPVWIFLLVMGVKYLIAPPGGVPAAPPVVAPARPAHETSFFAATGVRNDRNANAAPSHYSAAPVPFAEDGSEGEELAWSSAAPPPSTVVGVVETVGSTGSGGNLASGSRSSRYRSSSSVSSTSRRKSK